MFLNALMKQNMPFLDAVLKMHREGHLYPDTYIIDTDTFIENAWLIKQKADRLGIKLYGMTKQVGRNPYLAQCLLDIGYEGIVAVDFYEAMALAQAGIKIAHVGHLVQPPEAMLESIVTKIKPEVVTIYSVEKAKSLSKWCEKYQYTQNILLKFFDENDHLYINQEGGFDIKNLEEVIHIISALPNIVISGVTHFPCYLGDSGHACQTSNLATLSRAKEEIERLTQKRMLMNTPSLSCCATLEASKVVGSTHCEPGHALTGTTPINIDGMQPERIALLYLSEVSHQYGENSYCFAGGYYHRGHLSNALIDGNKIKVFNDDPNSIDYHLRLEGRHNVGSTVIMAFRTQIFTTRSRVALVQGISKGQPEVIGIYSSLGVQINE